MFTGIIAEQGYVLSVDRNGDTSATLRLHAPGTAEGLPLGGSIAVNGVCLTATAIDGKDFSVDVMGETLIRSTIGDLEAGDAVNLERCVPAGGRLDGHVVHGHVDGVGELLEREAQGNWERLRFAVPQRLARYIAEKGSIAIDGVSLTVTAVSPAAENAPWFEAGLILAETGLGAKAAGGKVNLEVDVLAKYRERLLSVSNAGTATEAQQ
jgi:riboflavin synthase